MITPISFNGTYLVTTNPTKRQSLRNKDIKSEKNFRAFKEYCHYLSKNNNKDVSINYSFRVRDNYPYYYDGAITLYTPDSMDSEVENYLNYNNIKYKKLKP